MPAFGQEVQQQVYGAAVMGNRIDLPFSFEEWEARARGPARRSFLVHRGLCRRRRYVSCEPGSIRACEAETPGAQRRQRS
jgi:hypothetical protein